jgi:hypothetical protein
MATTIKTATNGPFVAELFMVERKGKTTTYRYVITNEYTQELYAQRAGIRSEAAASEEMLWELSHA